jgi:hypothetical protein
MLLKLKSPLLVLKSIDIVGGGASSGGANNNNKRKNLKKFF